MSAEQIPVPDLETPRLRLRRLVLDDAPGLHEAYADAATMRFWDALPSGDLAETARRIRTSLDANPVWHAAWAVLRKDEGRFIGMVNYHARQAWNRRLAVGWILVPGARRRGWMTEATVALLRHCFGALEAHRIEAEIEPANGASEGLAERLGFQREGLLRDRAFVGGEPRSVGMWSLLRPEWQEPAGSERGPASS